MDGVKSDVLEFQRQFPASEPYTNNVEDNVNWLDFKCAISSGMIKHIATSGL